MASRIVSIVSRFPDVAAVYLFGSFARGEAGPRSDVDLGLVFRKRGTRARDVHRMIGDLASRLEAATHPHPVDLVILEEQGPIFAHRVLCQARRLYEADRERIVDFESDIPIHALDFRATYDLATRGRVEGLRRWLEQGRP